MSYMTSPVPIKRLRDISGVDSTEGSTSLFEAQMRIIGWKKISINGLETK